MQNNKFLRAIALILNLFVPGSVNIFAGSVIFGMIIICISFLNFFIMPYVPINLIRTIYAILLTTSYFYYFRYKVTKIHTHILKHIVFLIVAFIVLSIVSIKMTHIFLAEKSPSAEGGIVYVLGTKPFKKESTQKMLDMSNDELFAIYEVDVHPFFRRLRTGINSADIQNNTTLMISAGKNQKKIANRVLAREGKTATFFSCKSTKEEITAVKKHLNNDTAHPMLLLVSDDYHAFRSAMYARLKGFKRTRFLATSDHYSLSRTIKIYLTEQGLFALAYITMPLNIAGIVI